MSEPSRWRFQFFHYYFLQAIRSRNPSCELKVNGSILLNGYWFCGRWHSVLDRNANRNFRRTQAVAGSGVDDEEKRGPQRGR